MGILDPYKAAFASVGWFIPPYVQMGFLSNIVVDIRSKGGSFSQADLERYLAQIHDAQSMASMVMNRYPMLPFVRDHRKTIAEAVEAHFFGLNKVAVAGLLPVVEGIAKKVAASRSVLNFSLRNVFDLLADDCKKEVLAKGLGDTEEVVDMLDSFKLYTKNHLDADNKTLQTLPDNTNRHGILYGQYRDADFGIPINFYKVMSAVDFLAFVASIGASVSWMAPSPTIESFKLGEYYEELKVLRNVRATILPP